MELCERRAFPTVRLGNGQDGSLAKPAFTPPVFDQIGKFIEGCAGFNHHVGEIMARWIRPLGGLFERMRREIERWPRDPDGGFVPIWNVRLYRLAEEAYYGNDYIAQAGFLDESLFCKVEG